jgi:hypothetical protein
MKNEKVSINIKEFILMHISNKNWRNFSVLETGEYKLTSSRDKESNNKIFSLIKLT